ncbi:hypothetical protein POM88_028020 [Heracleum sosnowskyi]|uniref:NB-ARC domain-containing protein n=1 Tax=Heracleum sosnowskyi TaxID=360622 RepID=A0AAD8I944_9APIA|nr:hypothetical protein POM88_028020 [Heracleum sosnowskyi]
MSDGWKSSRSDIVNQILTWILEYKNGKTSVELPLTLVGERLAREMDMIDSFSTKDAWMVYPESFVEYFYFDKSEYEGEVFVGFQEETTTLLQQLASITKKQLEVISIVGMAGIGKTTLATRLYNHPYVVSYFYVRACVTCSQVYRKKELMLAILRSVTQNNDEVCGMNDNRCIEGP